MCPFQVCGSPIVWLDVYVWPFLSPPINWDHPVPLRLGLFFFSFLRWAPAYSIWGRHGDSPTVAYWALRFCSIWVLEWVAWVRMRGLSSLPLVTRCLGCLGLVLSYWQGSGLSCVGQVSHLMVARALSEVGICWPLSISGSASGWHTHFMTPCLAAPRVGRLALCSPARGGPLGNVVVQLPLWCVFGWRVKLLFLPSVCNVPLKK